MNRVFRALAGTSGAVLHADDPSDISVDLCEEHTLIIHTDPVNCRYWKEGQPDNWADNEDCGRFWEPTTADGTMKPAQSDGSTSVNDQTVRIIYFNVH